MEIINLEKLIAQSSQNPELQKVVKLDEAAKALLTNMQLPSNKLVRNAEEVKQYMEQQQQQQQNQPPDPNVLKAQAEMARIEVEKEKLALERERLQFQREQAYHQAQMQYAAKQEANDARVLEAQSGLVREQLKRDTALIQAGGRQEVEYAKLQQDAQKSERDLSIKEFMAGAKLELEANQQALTNKELELKRQTGSGI